ncbi:MAG: hypothetical protein V9G42_14080 [Bacteroidia bacterium]
MTSRRKYDEQVVMFYYTITCFAWMPIFEIANFYDVCGKRQMIFGVRSG